MAQRTSPADLLVVMDGAVKVLSQTSGKDKIAKLLQYVSKLAGALALNADPKSDTAAKAKRIESAAGAARKVFRLGNELNELQKIRALLKTGNFNLVNSLSLIRSIGMYWYWVFDHLVWAANLNLAKIDGPKYSYRGNFAYFVSLLAAITLDILTFNKTVSTERSLKYEQWKVAATPEAKQVINQQIKDAVTKKNETLLSLVKNFSDIAVSANLLQFISITQAKVGLLGTLSAMIALYQLFPALPR
eukprot:TRINITY_DN1070_c0_g1_i1.p1 TRINITY_DN1070_c0_g1~~TRINITY_DN1070_c0_g1_i1.p1  ORF type:complete len:246 (-),score=95.01 TRINITY_DN1070_c0_g1_i1:183-920(-)